MLSRYYQSRSFMDQVRRGPAGQYMDGFAQALWEDGYAQITARRHIRIAQHLVYWAQDQELRLAEMDGSLVQRFKDHLSQCQCPTFGRYDQGGQAEGIYLFLEQLRRV